MGKSRHQSHPNSKLVDDFNYTSKTSKKHSKHIKEKISVNNHHKFVELDDDDEIDMKYYEAYKQII